MPHVAAPVQTHTNNVVIMLLRSQRDLPPTPPPFFFLSWPQKTKIGRLWVLICLGGDGLATGTRNRTARAVILVFQSI